MSTEIAPDDPNLTIPVAFEDVIDDIETVISKPDVDDTGVAVITGAYLNPFNGISNVCVPPAVTAGLEIDLTVAKNFKSDVFLVSSFTIESLPFEDATSVISVFTVLTISLIYTTSKGCPVEGAEIDFAIVILLYH